MPSRKAIPSAGIVAVVAEARVTTLATAPVPATSPPKLLPRDRAGLMHAVVPPTVQYYP